MTTKQKKSDHFDGEKFFNPWGANNSKNLWDVFKWKMSTTPKKWPLFNEVINSAVPKIVHNREASSIHITYIGHATTYIQNENQSILTDPQFAHRASPVSFAGPSRVRLPAIDIDQIPSLDLVLISHNHYDHLDLPTLKILDKKFKPKFILPLGNAKFLKSVGIHNIVELDWWEEFENVTLVPAQHWSARGFNDKNKALWGGFVINMSNKKIFFAGDTGYGPQFKMIHEKLGAMDISILPIGAYEPRWFMKDQHMNPDDAVLAHLDLESRTSFAIHFETFQLTDEAFLEPREKLQVALSNYNLSSESFMAPEVGETLIID